MGLKWEFHKESPGNPLPALGASFYVEFPTGDVRHRLFAGNTSTGVLGINKVRGHVFAGGLMSQNRKDKKDRLRGELDFDVNRRADSEIVALTRKLSALDQKVDDLSDMLRKPTQDHTVPISGLIQGATD